MLKLPKASCVLCRFCAHNSKKFLVKAAAIEYFESSIKPEMKGYQATAHNLPVTSSDFSSALIESESESENLSGELPRVLYNERDTYPRDLPPEFVTNYPFGQSKVLKWLEWGDMMKRRRNLDIPEFYPGSILKVQYADPYATNGMSSFVGRVLYRSVEAGLRHSVFLRNVIDGEGVEMEIQLYSPRVHSIQLLRLERWLDQDLLFLRNADPKMCTIPLTMEPEPIPEEVPVFTGKVKMMPKPWDYRWERFNLKNMDRSYLRVIDKERASRFIYYEFDHSKDIHDDATDQISFQELNEIKKILSSSRKDSRKEKHDGKERTSSAKKSASAID